MSTSGKSRSLLRLARRGRSEGTEAPDASKRSSETAEKQGLAPGLYVVATPIGNAADITLRALDVLTRADVIACEDTRVTAKLLAIHHISRPLLRYDEHTARQAGPLLVQRAAGGERVALVSDAGTPLLSDPGERLVRAFIEAHLPVTALPGASAVLTALAVSGLPACPFHFLGFPPPRQAARLRAFADLANLPATLVLLESPQRLAATLADIAQALGPREVAVARELTKLFEEVRRGTADELAAHYAEAGPPRGEVTVVVGPPPDAPVADEAEAEKLLVQAVGRLSARDAAAEVAAATGLPRRALYARAVELKGQSALKDQSSASKGQGE